MLTNTQGTSPSHHNWTLVGFLQLTHINPQSAPSRTTDIYQCQFETAISMNNKYVSTTLMTPSVLIDTVKMLGNGHLALFLGFIKCKVIRVDNAYNHIQVRPDDNK